MQTQNPFLDELAKLTTAAMGLAQSAGDEAKTALRAHADRIAAEFDLVRREDFEALKAQVAALSLELTALKSPESPGTSAGEPPPKAAPKSRKTGQ